MKQLRTLAKDTPSVSQLCQELKGRRMRMEMLSLKPPRKTWLKEERKPAGDFDLVATHVTFPSLGFFLFI